MIKLLAKQMSRPRSASAQARVCQSGLAPLARSLEALRADDLRPFACLAQAGLAAGIKERFGLAKPLAAVKNIRGVGKRHMIHNDYAPKMEVDAQTYTVRADGQLLVCEPATALPMAQRYFLF